MNKKIEHFTLSPNSSSSVISSSKFLNISSALGIGIEILCCIICCSPIICCIIGIIIGHITKKCK
jgi:hypothetical protein